MDIFLYPWIYFYIHGYLFMSMDIFWDIQMYIFESWYSKTMSMVISRHLFRYPNGYPLRLCLKRIYGTISFLVRSIDLWVTHRYNTNKCSQSHSDVSQSFFRDFCVIFSEIFWGFGGDFGGLGVYPKKNRVLGMTPIWGEGGVWGGYPNKIVALGVIPISPQKN